MKERSPLAEGGEALRSAFQEGLKENVPIAPFTSARIGGPADFLIEARSDEHLAEVVSRIWELGFPLKILGGGSNVLVSDLGIRGVVVLNKARKVEFLEEGEGLWVQAESGATLGTIARRAAKRGWGGLEWAATVPGSLGGAVVGNAGAHGGDIAGSLGMAEILQREGEIESWSVDRLEYAYRDSWLKRNPGRAVVLQASLGLESSSTERCEEMMRSFLNERERTQPHGASMGSMFVNPPDDFAGRLIDAAGLKGQIRGDAQISPLHGNFFINLGGAKAADVRQLIDLARDQVGQQFGVDLELEIELLGEWDNQPQPGEQS